MADWTPYKITTPAAEASAGIALAAQAAKIGGILKADGQGNVSTAEAGTEYGYGMIKGNGVPDNTTAGEIGQHYFDMTATQMPYEYICVGFTMSGYVWKVYGEAGTGFELKGRFSTLDALKEAIASGLVDEPEYGDAYLIGDTQPYDCYYYSKTAKDWENIGPLGGDGGTGGDLPKGGILGQVLLKNSAVDYDTAWGTELVENCIESSMIQSGAVTTGKIESNAITTGKLAAGAVTRAKCDAAVMLSPTAYPAATYAITAADGGKTFVSVQSGVNTFTLTQAVSATLPLGTEIAFVYFVGTGVTFQGTGIRMVHPEVDVYTPKGFKITTMYNLVAIKKLTTDTTLGDVWLVIGDVEALT